MHLDSILKKIKSKKWELGILVFIIVIGIFLRTYHFSSWLHFEIDQAYDFNLVSPAIENGISNLPLLGTNVGGGLLRLGPSFYYMEYVSAMIFGNTPTGHAMSVLILSILSLPLFYFFCKKYFSAIESLGLLTIFSVSLFSVLYSRFSWSPNVLPFLILLSFYALLRSVSSKEKHPAHWFLVSVATVTITSQIHLNSLFVIPAVAVIFIAIKRPRFNWKVWLSALAIIFILYSPAILNDIKTNGQNIKYFKTKLLRTGTRTAPIGETITQDFMYNAYEYLFINTSNDQINGIKLNNYGLTCDSCKENVSIKIFSIIIFLLALLILAVNIFKEKDKERKNFLILAGLWFLVSFFLFYTIAKGYRMYPRFFLIVSPLAIIFYGFILKYIRPEQNKKRLTLFVLVIFVFMILNVQKIIPIFNQLKSVPSNSNQDTTADDIFPNTNRITLKEQELLADYIEAKYKENNYPVYVKIQSEYEPSIWVLLEQRGIHYYDELNNESLFTEGNYFNIKFATAGSDIGSKFSLLEAKNFGTLTAYYINPLPQFATVGRQAEYDRKKSEEAKIDSKLLTWKNLFTK